MLLFGLMAFVLAGLIIAVSGTDDPAEINKLAWRYMDNTVVKQVLVSVIIMTFYAVAFTLAGALTNDAYKYHRYNSVVTLGNHFYVLLLRFVCAI